ncbi:MAG TPA: Nif3-like dinuclear metal center hexameric protein [Rectinemataceae bacterium]|nr:Nif3-like dinuclear metal center hexameric protein [Rectinemataceae bacterium]
MKLSLLDAWFRDLLDPDALAGVDDSLNGLQVSRSGAELDRVAFAVDASLESIRRAAEAGAQLLFVHHGLFWGKPLRIEGFLRERIKLLLDADLALWACHLPLDRHPVVGNNAVLADMLGLVDREPFGLYHGVKLGFKGRFPEPIDLAEARRRVLPDGSPALALIPAGPASIGSAAVISGGAAFEVNEAIKEGLDLYVTGEASHSIYAAVVESSTSFLAAGHYGTEVHGVKAVAARLGRETGLETLFLDLPTGL